jgi:hypothetical protein
MRGAIGTTISREAAASPIMTSSGIDGGCEGGLTRIGQHSVTILIRLKLRAHAVEGHRGHDMDRGNKGVESTIQPIKNIVFQFIVVNLLASSSEFRDKSFHHGKIDLDRFVKIFGVCQGTAQRRNPRL